MPYYTIRDNRDGTVRDMNLKISEKEDLLKNNPYLQQIFTKFPSIGDPVRLGVIRPDNSFNDVLKNVKSKHAHSTIET